VASDPAPSRARRNLLVTLVGAVLVAGLALWVGGAMAARATDSADDEPDGAVRSPSTTAPSTTTTMPTTTTSTIPPTTTTTAPPAAGADGTLQSGEEGDEVVALQARLAELGYWHGPSDGRYGQLTRQAVMAFQKAEGLGRDGVAGPATLAALVGATRPAPLEPTGDHLEIDLGRQILLVVEGGQTTWVLNTSTGNGEAYAAPGGGTAVAATPTGRFAITREIDGLREAPLGTLYRPKYFVGGIAIHGSGSIPSEPASHGCARLTNDAMDLLWSSGLAPLGTPVLVH
jgi:peptidoglycan hydrolase-like protein with peptidoglycan-binding domain